MMTSRQSEFPIGGEGNTQTTHGYIAVECQIQGDSVCFSQVLCMAKLLSNVKITPFERLMFRILTINFLGLKALSLLTYSGH